MDHKTGGCRGKDEFVVGRRRQVSQRVAMYTNSQRKGRLASPRALGCQSIWAMGGLPQGGNYIASYAGADSISLLPREHALF